jgi:hypothetical protein
MAISRLLADGRFYDRENARACQDLLSRAITRRSLPEVFYCDYGASFSNAWLARTCGVLTIRLVHSRSTHPRKGKQGRANRYIREAFLAEATHHGIESLDQLNDLSRARQGNRATTRWVTSGFGRYAAGSLACATRSWPGRLWLAGHTMRNVELLPPSD